MSFNMLGLGLKLGLGGYHLPILPNGYVFLIDNNNCYLTDDDGNYLIVRE